MEVPILDLKAQYSLIKSEIDLAIQQVIEDADFVRGKYVKNFEEAYQEAYGVRHCIGVGNGTDAIYIALKMMGIGEGDEVITAANSCISSSETISLTGASPIFADADPDFYTLDPDAIRKKITKATKAILPVHLYGQTCDMDSIMQIADEYGLLVMEDCAHAHFSEDQGRKVGLFGQASAFSFYPSKNLGAYGDAGCILTNDDELAEKIRMYANHGSLTKHEHLMEGVNSRLDNIQAAILKVKLNHIRDWISKRRAHAAFYDENLKDLEQIITPAVRPGSHHTYHLYVIRCLGEERDELQSYLAAKGIGTGIHYPEALPGLKAYQHLDLNRADYPVSMQYESRILSLPMYPELSTEMLAYVCENIREFYSRH